ncbi:IclR family transcriptional regulator [Paracoccus aurantiacus]|uniref:IclR family transcriptional regulator n=1 Tax=Paracoccus aurantiacus TaxID=2599412 RepID=A0A5C6RYT3_9RHOB|nr:IclR family transcriptional regulator [Paracoccus aurantiacus]TXB67431.1 IclR family transcriptional regulator [Paracoccus aurantiacus]
MTSDEGANQSPRNGIQVIGRAAAILRALRDDPEGLSLGQISTRVGLARSTVQRIVSALQEERLVTTIGNAGIRLGPEIASLAAAAKFDAVPLCRPYLTHIVDKTGETADLSVLRDGVMVFLDQVPGTHRLRAVSSVGERFPLTTTANGRATLALFPDDEARQMAEAEWSASSEKPDWDGLRRILAEIRKTGFASDRDEHTEGISAVGIAMRSHLDEIYAVSIPVPSHRFDLVRALVTKEILRSAREIRRHLGALGAN